MLLFFSQNNLSGVQEYHQSVKQFGSRIQDEGLCFVGPDLGLGGGVAQCLGHQISDQGDPGSNPGRCRFLCGLEQVTFTLLGTG